MTISKRQFYCVLVILFFNFNVQPANAASLAIPIYGVNAINNPVPSKQTLRIAQMKMFAGLTAEQYGTLRGKKLNFMERFSFRISQNRMKKMLKQYDYGEVTTLQKISWLLKGLLLGPIAVLLAYIFLQDEERELIKWTWFGFAGFAIVLAIVLISL